MDLTSVTTSITDSLADVTTLGLACLGIYVAIKTFGWVRGGLK